MLKTYGLISDVVIKPAVYTAYDVRRAPPRLIPPIKPRPPARTLLGVTPANAGQPAKSLRQLLTAGTVATSVYILNMCPIKRF